MMPFEQCRRHGHPADRPTPCPAPPAWPHPFRSPRSATGAQRSLRRRGHGRRLCLVGGVVGRRRRNRGGRWVPVRDGAAVRAWPTLERACMPRAASVGWLRMRRSPAAEDAAARWCSTPWLQRLRSSCYAGHHRGNWSRRLFRWQCDGRRGMAGPHHLCVARGVCHGRRVGRRRLRDRAAARDCVPCRRAARMASARRLWDGAARATNAARSTATAHGRAAVLLSAGQRHAVASLWRQCWSIGGMPLERRC